MYFQITAISDNLVLFQYASEVVNVFLLELLEVFSLESVLPAAEIARGGS